MKTKTNYTVDDYEIRVRYECYPEHPETACYTAQVLEMPGLIYGGRTPEAAVSECRAELADTIKWFAEEGWELPEPGSRPPERDPDALAEPLVKIPAQVKSAAATLGRKGGYVKSAVKAASSRRNLLKARAMGKVGGRPKGSKTKKKVQ